VCAPAGGSFMSQAEIIATVNSASAPEDALVCAAGSLPGDLHRLWCTRMPGGYHLEYGYSTMGYELSGGIGAKLACPEREVVVMLGDGSYLMMPSEIVTAVQEGIKITVVLIDNHGFASIGGLSESLGTGGFGARYRYRTPEGGQLEGAPLPLDFVANARSLGAEAVRATDRDSLSAALARARASDRTTVIVVETEAGVRAPGYESWWDVPVAEVSESEAVRAARVEYEQSRRLERYFLR
jgi:3D-(3,5/4)-trihydroxycyclohexane-1,2-dione acylhydrolase (decyclizing)